VLLQVSRWDETKGVLGVLESFTTSVARSHPDLHLVLLGPDPAAVAGDPGGQAVFDAAMAHLLGAEEDVRSRVHLVRTSGSDLEGTAFIVNAVQQWADLISQKSLCEGFGLTVTEAKWKSKPVVAAAVGGIPSQLRDGDTGLLVTDSHDLTAFAAAVGALADDDELRARLARRAHEDVAERFLFSRQLPDYLRVYESVLR
jgi:trehalose synthase